MFNQGIRTILAIATVSLIAGCGGSSGGSADGSIDVPVATPPPQPPAAPVLESFSLLKTDNPDLPGDIEFVREGDTFFGHLETDAPVTELTPSFTFVGEDVSLGGVQQISGSNNQDFTQILTYRVTNEAGTAEDYQVDLTRFTGLSLIHI